MCIDRNHYQIKMLKGILNNLCDNIPPMANMLNHFSSLYLCNNFRGSLSRSHLNIMRVNAKL